jgi:hypothetical protein
VAGRSTEDASRPGGLAIRARDWPTSVPLLGQAPKEKEPQTQTERPGDLVCVSVGRYFFFDPKWGPISFDFSIWRHKDDDSPSYEVVIE